VPQQSCHLREQQCLTPPHSAVPEPQHSAQVPSPQQFGVEPLHVLAWPQVPLLHTPRRQLAVSPGQSPSTQHWRHWPLQQNCVQLLCWPQVPFVQTPVLQVAGSAGHSASPQQSRQPMPVQHFWVPVQAVGKLQRLSVPQVFVVQGSLSSHSAALEHCGRSTQPVVVQSCVVLHFEWSAWCVHFPSVHWALVQSTPSSGQSASAQQAAHSPVAQHFCGLAHFGVAG
jgi:hypothetical protein